MSSVQVVSGHPRAGKTTVAVALALGFAGEGLSVRLARTGAGDPAAGDAAAFGAFTFAATPGQPIAAASLPDAQGITIFEADAGALALEAAPGLLVLRGSVTDEDRAAAKALAENLLGTIATNVPADGIDALAHQLTDSGFRPLALLPEDPVLAAPGVREVRDALGAQVLHDADNWDEVTEDVVVSPIYTDPARPYLRRFGSKTVLAPHNKTDLLLAAVHSGAPCVVVTGGQQPSPYVLDRVRGEATTLLLAPQKTAAAVAALAGAWASAPFRGEAKAHAALALLESRVSVAGLAKKLL